MNSVDFELQVKWMEKSQDDLSQERKYCQLFSARRGSPFPYGWINLTDEQQNTLMEKYKCKLALFFKPSWLYEIANLASFSEIDCH